jgi:PAS domain S-box-containing protein
VRLDPRVVQIATEPDPSRRIERLLDAAHELLHADGVALSLVDGESGDVRVARSRGALHAPGAGQSWVCAPVRDTDGVIGTLSAHRGVDGFSDDDESFLALLATLVGSALRETGLVERVRSAHHALVDGIESLEDGFLLYDADDRLVLSNQRLLELVPAVADVIKPGVRFEDVVRVAAARGYYPGADRSVDDVVSGRLRQQLVPDGRIELHVGDDRIVQVKERRTRDGGRLILVTDITELRRTTAALEVSERNYRLMVDGVDDIMYRIDPSGVFTYVNPRVADVLGWTAEELVGTLYLDLIRPDYRTSARRFYLRQFARRIPTTYYEFPSVARDGATVWVGQHVRLVEEDGQPVGALAVARDITARKRAEAHERDRLLIVEAIARNAPLAQTLEQLVGLSERRAPGWKGAVLLSQGGGRRLTVAPGWPAALVEALAASERELEATSLGVESATRLGSNGRRRGGIGHDRGRSDSPTPLVRRADLAGLTAWLAPIRGRDDSIAGLWAMVADDGSEPDAATTLLVAELVQLAAIAVEHARLTERLEARVTRARTMNQLAQLISSSLDLETVLSEIARAAGALLGAPVARFWMVDEEAQTIWLAADASEGPGLNHGPNKLSIGDLRGVLGWVTSNRQPVVIPDAAVDPRVVDAGWWAERGLTSFLGQPVLLDGRLLAVLVLWGRAPFAFDDDDDTLLESFVSQAALSIRNAQLYRDTDQQRRRLQSLVEVSHRLSRGLDLTEVLDAITEAAAAIFEGEAGVRLLVGDELVRASVSRGSAGLHA